MSRKLYFVELTDEERAELEALVSAGNHSAQKLTRARILLKSDEGWSDPKIAEALDCGRATVQRTRERFSRERLGAIERKKPNRIYACKLDGNAEAHLIALAGRFTSSQTNLSRLTKPTSSRSLTKPFDRFSKKRTTVSPLHPVGDPSWPKRQVRLPDGRCSCILPRTVR